MFNNVILWRDSSLLQKLPRCLYIDISVPRTSPMREGNRLASVRVINIFPAFYIIHNVPVFPFLCCCYRYSAEALLQGDIWTRIQNTWRRIQTEIRICKQASNDEYKRAQLRNQVSCLFLLIPQSIIFALANLHGSQKIGAQWNFFPICITDRPFAS
jgi:hypothetical protein